MPDMNTRFESPRLAQGAGNAASIAVGGVRRGRRIRAASALRIAGRSRSRPYTAILFALTLVAAGCGGGDQRTAGDPSRGAPVDAAVRAHADELLDAGRDAFRFDTLGDQVFWGDTLRLHDAVAGAANGGVGPGLSPRGALQLGLKVDAEALPPELRDALAAGEVDLDSPATTLGLLQLDSVVGVTGFFDESRRLTSIGIQCALCHSTVDDSLAPGIGRRLDGWANRDLDVGAIIAFAPDVSVLGSLLGVDDETVRSVLRSWGPGKFDAALLLDGKAFRPDGTPAATLIPPAYGLGGVNLHTWTGWGSVSHWNALVATLEMQGQGTFYDPRLDDAERFPIAARTGAGHVHSDPDLVTPTLAALQFYQLALPVPSPAPGSFDPQAAARGARLFAGAAHCATCHVPPLFTEPGWNLHRPEEIGIDDFQSGRSPDGRYRTAPLRGLSAHAHGGFYHDGRFPTLAAVVDHYDGVFGLGLADGDKADLVEYLKSL